VPFISRYRKEATGGLDDAQLRLLEDRLRYLRELEDRRAAIIQSVTDAEQDDAGVAAGHFSGPRQDAVEDLYLPYKPKRRSKAQIALEAGLEPLADALLANPMLNPDEAAARYLRDPFATEQGDNPGVADAKAALDGARQILMERFAEDAGLLQSLREYVQEHGVVEFQGARGQGSGSGMYADYFDIRKPSTPSLAPRVALFRGRRAEDMLDVRGASKARKSGRLGARRTIPARARIASRFGILDQKAPPTAG